MEPSDSDNKSNEAQQLAKHKRKLDKAKEAKDGCCQKALKYLKSIDDGTEENVHIGMEILKHTKGMSTSLNALAEGIKSMNKDIISYFRTSQAAQTMASETISSIFDDEPFDQTVQNNNEELVAMSENMADTLRDEQEHLGDIFSETGDSIVRVVDDLGDDFDEFRSMTDNGALATEDPQVVSDSQDKRLQAIEDQWKDNMLLSVQSIEKSTLAVAEYFKKMANEKKGKVGESSEEGKEKDSKFSLSDMLAGLLGLKALKSFLKKKFGKGLLKGFVEGLQKFLKKVVGGETFKLFKKLFMWPFKFMKTNLKMLFRPLNKKLTNMLIKPIRGFIGSIAAGLSMQMALLKGNVGGWLGKSTKMLSKFLPKSLTGILAKLLPSLGKSVVSIVGKAAGSLLRVVGKFFGFFAFAAWDFYQGFTDKGTEAITGIKAENQTMWDKFHSGISSLLSGMTLGLIDSKKIYEFTNQLGDWVWKYVTDPLLNMIPKIGESISKLIDDMVSLFPKSWREAGAKLGGIFGMGDDGKKEKKPDAYESSAAYLNKRKLMYQGQIMSEESVKNPLHVLPVQDANNMSVAPVSATPMSLNTQTASNTDKFAAQARQKKEPAQSVQPVIVQQGQSGNKSSGVSRALSTGRSDINRSIGRGTQFGFGG